MATPGSRPARVLMVRTGEERVGLPVDAVREVARDLRIAPVAGGPSYLLGIAGFRGEPIAILDLAGLRSGGVGDQRGSPVVAVTVLPSGARVGLACDEAAGVTTVDLDADAGERTHFDRGTAPDGVIDVLRLEALERPWQ